MPSYGQGPSMSALAAQQQQMHSQQFIPAQKTTTLFVGSISAGITDTFLNQLLEACGQVRSFKRLITPAGKPQGFGFAEFETPDGALRAIALLNGVELTPLEDGAPMKKLLIKADEKAKLALDAYQSQRMHTDADDSQLARSKKQVEDLVRGLNQEREDAANAGNLDKERYVIPPHLHDLQEADLPEAQRGLVVSEIALFRERAAKRERDKAKEVPAVSVAPNAPKQREWGKPQPSAAAPSTSSQSPPRYGNKGAQGYDKPVGFVKAQDGHGDRDAPSLSSRIQKTDEELEAEKKEARRRDEENSFRDRERRYEPRERSRIQKIERGIAREKALREAEERDKAEMKRRLHEWDDDESDEPFYVERARWRSTRARRLAAEEAADNESRIYEEKEAENLRKESEAFLARQMDELQALAEEQRNAGMLLDDGAPIKLNMNLAPAAPKTEATAETKVAAFAQDDEEEGYKKRKVPLVKLDFSATEGEKAKELLEKIKNNLSSEKDVLFKTKVRWDGISDQLIDRKLEPLIKRLMTKYLGELEDDDLIMFSVEHLKDHKGPHKLVEGLEPVLEEEAVEFVIGLWRQVIFESLAYAEGLNTEWMMAD
ncbi:hypothetical protein SCHPADRAFT_909891 [Schizopora paradoxa]|uniref:RRM domain-containing protein n=1 Tax=Schizopora paradoxa TaxID=27342 RepID=A0A0H2R6K2_9AGAM|nr:hypothetical protein SCHPADRAFT_909891 [Schizopora paradoxa]